MNKPVLVIAVGLTALLCFSCKEKSANPETQAPGSFSYESSKCMRGVLQKASVSDSVFTYTFSDKLIIDFSVTANCCPDSNRFSVSSTTGIDTIVVAVVDTAQNLCKCICPYMIHAEFGNLPNDHYVVHCTIGNSQGYTDPIHLVNVYKN